MGISAEVQSVLDKVRNQTSLVASVDAGIGAMRTLIAAQNEKLANIPVTPKGLSEDDKAALLETGEQLDHTAEALQKDIPANVADAGGAPSDGTVQPLAGTGDAAPAEEAKPIE